MACGLCCNGVLHGYTWVRPDERDRVAAAGLDVRPREDRFAFTQPCTAHRDTHCAIYADRPHHCRTYRCKLLRAVDDGRLAEATAHERVRKTREVVARLRGALGTSADGRPLWQRVGDLLEDLRKAEDPVVARRQHAAVLTDATALELMSRRWFLLDD